MTMQTRENTGFFWGPDGRFGAEKDRGAARFSFFAIQFFWD